MDLTTYLPLIELGIGFLEKYLGNLKAAKAPIEIIEDTQAALNSLLTHQADVISKANLDSLRG